MRKKLNLTGQRFGRLVVIEEGKQRKYMRVFLCRCDCGKETTVQMSHLRTGGTKSCGCYKKDTLTKHGYSSHRTQHPLYACWHHMQERCYNKNDQGYKYYGERGIRICDEWKNDVKAFCDWAIANGWKKGLQIDRFPDNDGNYEPSNCRFTTSRKNNLNKRLLNSKNTSGYIGVYWNKAKNRWQSAITIKGRKIYLGCSNEKEKPLIARNNYIIEHNLQHEYRIQDIK